MQYCKFDLESLLNDPYKDPNILRFTSDEYVNTLWIATCVLLNKILTQSQEELPELYSKQFEHICSISDIKDAFISSNEVKFGFIISKFYSSVLSHYPIIPLDLSGDVILYDIYNLLYNVHDFIKYYTTTCTPFKYGKCIRLSSIYEKLLIQNIEYHNDSIKDLIKQLKQKIRN